MALKMLSKMLDFRRGKENHLYTRMEVNEHGPGALESTFQETTDNTGTSIFDRWPNFTIEEEYKEQYDRQSIRSSGSGAGFVSRRSREQLGFFTGIKRMFTTFPARDMSFLVGFIFAIGSAVFVANGFFLLLPLIAPTTNFPEETPYATPATSVVGTVVFIIGGWVAVLEALNLKRGKEVILIEEIILEEGSMFSTPFDEDTNAPSTFSASSEEEMQEKTNSKSDNKNSKSATLTTTTRKIGESSTPESKPQATYSIALLGSPEFIHWPSWFQYLTLYQTDPCFIASIIQFIGTLVFGLATLTALPNIIDLNSTFQLRVFNLLPASLGGLLFVIASVIQMLLTQEKWWCPNPGRTDWWVGWWNTIGSLGFLLAGALPYVGNETAGFWGVVADFWGSWAFFAGGLVQWYFVVGRYE